MKYHNKKVVIDGIKFASIAEGRMYQNLKLMEKTKKIRLLRLQEPYVLQEAYTTANGEKIRPIIYRADFVFVDMEEKRTRVIDCKGFKTAVYKLKKKLFDYRYKQFGLFLEEHIGRRRNA